MWKRQWEAELQIENNEKKAFIIPNWLENSKNKSDKSTIVVTVLQCYASLHLLLIEWQFLFMVGYPGNLDSKWKMLTVKDFSVYYWELATDLRNNLLLDPEN